MTPEDAEMLKLLDDMMAKVEKDILPRPYRCHHCYMTTYMERLTAAPINISSEEMFAEEKWMVLLCPNCDQKNLVYGIYSDQDEPYSGDVIIYPPTKTASAPNDISLVFQAANKISGINPKASVVLLRVILEMIWRDKVAEDNPVPTMVASPRTPNLRGKKSQIQQLVDGLHLAGPYAEMADVLAHVGDFGAHVKEKDVSAEDATTAIDLCKAILDHIYGTSYAGTLATDILNKKFPRKNGWHHGEYMEEIKKGES